LLEPVREFALACLAEHDEVVHVRQRHSEYFLGLVEDLDERIDRPDARTWHEQIEAERDNLRGALRWLRESGQVELGLLLVGRLGKTWHVRGYGREALVQADAFLDLPAATRPTFGRAKALNAVSWLCQSHGDADRIVPLADEACAIFEALDDRYHQANALLGRGIGHFRQGNDEQARVDWERALPLFQEVGNRADQVRVLANLGELARRQGDLDRARVLAEEGLAIGRAGGHRHVTALALGALGEIAEQAGDDAWAAALYRERIGIYHELGLPWHTAEAIEQLAGIAYGHGQLERAARLLGAAAVVWEWTGATRTRRTDKVLRAVRERLDDANLQAAWIEGQAMTLDEAVAYALSEPAELPTAADEDARTVAGLSRRETEVLHLLVEGKSNQEIAATLFISPNTVTNHVANIMNKLGLDSRTAVATWAVRRGLA
jgi:non-specific serine/threonine protein kinase